MRDIRICDETMKRAAAARDLTLSFKEKLELAKLLDDVGVDAIEVEGIERRSADMLRIKSLSQLITKAALVVPVRIDGSDIDDVWSSLTEAQHPRLQVPVSTSPARMEYVHGMKGDALLTAIEHTVGACRACCDDVEFVAEDATRTDPSYLTRAIQAARAGGATSITVCDDAGTLLPEEFAHFISSYATNASLLNGAILGMGCSDELHMAVASAIAAIEAGAETVKATTYPLGEVFLPDLASVIAEKSSSLHVASHIDTTVLKRTATQIRRICEQGVPKASLFSTASPEEAASAISLDASDDRNVVYDSVRELGYDLSDEDLALVYESFLRIASKKDTVSGRELDAIVATAALQAPAKYKLVQYTINSGNAIKASAYVKIEVDGETIERVGMGDGPIDAALAAVDDIIGRSFELDDWQMQSVTEGQEAMGEAVIKLVSDGRLYSGRGISTDIVGSSIRAYINAVNKAVFEEDER